MAESFNEQLLTHDNESISVDQTAVSSALIDAISYVTLDIEPERLMAAGFQKEETFGRCTYNGIKCNLDEMKQFLDPQFGNCFIFNWNGTLWAKKAGSSTGRYNSTQEL